MPIEWNKVTWYSKLLAVVLFVVVFYVGFKLGGEKKEVTTDTVVVPEKTTTKTTPISITKKDITEENFSATVPVIAGEGVLADAARAYVNTTVAEFKKQADIDIPAMREEFGVDAPSASYEINIDAKYTLSGKTESIIVNVYAYTGSANGNSYYKALTASVASGKILSLSSVVKTEEQTAFTVFVQKQLLAWKPSGAEGSPVFPEDVNSLKFNSFTNWSLDDKNLILYFAKYEVGPGVLGPVAFPIPLSKITQFLNATYL